MELMTFRQNEHETTDEFVNRARHKGSLCDFGEPELVERIIELIIATTPHELLQKHLLDQDKGYSLDHVLTEARKYEAIAAGKPSLQSLKIPHHTVNGVKHRNLCIILTVRYLIHVGSVRHTTSLQLILRRWALGEMLPKN